MRLPVILLLSGAVLLGSGVPALAVPSEPVKVAQAQGIKTPWRLWTSSKYWAGEQIKLKEYGETKTLEAAGRWLTLEISVRNNSNRRHSVKDIFAWIEAELVDSAGQAYRADYEAGQMSKEEESLSKKPFEPGEVRVMKLTFDVPTNVRVSNLKLYGYDVKRDLHEFSIKY